jgi:hypothetical protein
MLTDYVRKSVMDIFAFRNALVEDCFICKKLHPNKSSKNPQWGWGWIGWSDCYRFTRSELKDMYKAEELLQEGFSITGLRDF